MDTQFHGHALRSATAYNLENDGLDLRLSENFTLGEFACRDGSKAVLVHHALVELVQRIRDEFGPLHVVSGYRTGAHNRAVGGKSRSRHLYGLAADIVCRSATPRQIADFAETLGVGGLACYASFVHVDVQGHNRRWGS